MSNQPQSAHKFVWYYGHKLRIPDDHYYVATDESGLICSYRNRPARLTYDNCWGCHGSYHFYVCKILGSRCSELDIYWQDTLVEYPTDYVFTEKKQ